MSTAASFLVDLLLLTNLFAPIGQLKHATQKTYNNGKWGLDKCTENWHKVQLETNVPLEPKYVLRMFDGIVANVWKFEQGRSLGQGRLE